MWARVRVSLMNSDAFEYRLFKAMEGASKRSFAEKCGISEGSLRSYLRGDTTPDLNTLGIIAEVSSYSLAWLASGEGAMKPGDATYPLSEGHKGADATGEPAEGFVHIPRYEVSASAGAGSIIHSEQIVDHLTFRSDWVRNALGVPLSSLALINVKGDSMEPTLSNGDVILVDMSKDGFDDNAVYVLRLNGTLLVKRVKRNLDGSVLVSSDNVMYPPDLIKVDVVDTLGVVGRVVWCGRRM